MVEQVWEVMPRSSHFHTVGEAHGVQVSEIGEECHTTLLEGLNQCLAPGVEDHVRRVILKS